MMINKIAIILCYLTISTLTLSKQTANAQTNLVQNFVNTSGLENASVGIMVKRVSDGKIIAQHNPHTSQSIASLTKIFSTWLALEKYGSTYKYTTSVSYSGQILDGSITGDLIIKASGDPTFNSRYFPNNNAIKTIVQSLTKHNIKTIQGNIIIEELPYKSDVYGSWVWEDISNYYAAIPHSINYKDNSYTIEFKSSSAGQLTKIISIDPKPDNTKFINEVVAANNNSDNAWIFGGPYSNTIHIKGSIPANRASFKIRGSMSNPQTIFLKELNYQLATSDIKILKETNKLQNKTLLTNILSPNLIEIIKVTNKISHNLYAEALGKLVAKNDWTKTSQTLLSSKGIYSKGLLLKDANGLSPQTIATARTITDLLVYIHKQNKYEYFSNSLAICGQDSGLNAFGYPLLTGKLKAKTGSMAGVQCLAGYVEGKNNELYAFTIIVNNFTCSRGQVKESIATLLSQL